MFHENGIDMETFTFLVFVLEPVNLFGLVYALVLGLGLIFMVGVGIRKQYPTGTWVALVATVMVLFVTGMKLSAYSADEWLKILAGSHEGVNYIKYLPGGILLVALGIPLIKRFLKFRLPVFDSLVLFLPVLGIIQRTGCLLNGCCYGTHTELPWALHYGPPSPLYYEQLDAGLLRVGQMHSLGVHPTQLYTIVMSLGILAVLWLTRRRFHAPGSRTLFALLLMGGMRFVLEFFRAARPDTWSASQIGFLNGLQWLLVVAMAGMAFALWRRQRGSEKVSQEVGLQQDQPLRAVVVVMLLLFGMWQVREVYDPLELMVLYPLLFAGLLIFASKLLLQAGRPVTRLAMGTLLLAAFFSMGQTLEDSAADTLAFQPKGWFSLGLYGGAGSYENISRDCGGDIIDRYRRDYTQWGSSAAYHYQKQPDYYWEVGLRQYYLADLIQEDNYFDDRYLYFFPYISYDTPKVGALASYGYGFNMNRQEGEPGEYNVYRLKPALALRVGRRDKTFFEFDLNNRTHFMGPPAYMQYSIGHGFNQYYGTVVRGGLTIDEENRAGVFFGGDALIKNRLVLKPYVMMSKYPSFAFGVEYHFGKEK